MVLANLIILARGSRLASEPAPVPCSPSGWLGSRQIFPPIANGDSACSPFRMAGCWESRIVSARRLQDEFHSMRPTVSNWATGWGAGETGLDSLPSRERYPLLRRTSRGFRGWKSRCDVRNGSERSGPTTPRLPLLATVLEAENRVIQVWVSELSQTEVDDILRA